MIDGIGVNILSNVTDLVIVIVSVAKFNIKSDKRDRSDQLNVVHKKSSFNQIRISSLSKTHLNYSIGFAHFLLFCISVTERVTLNKASKIKLPQRRRTEKTTKYNRCIKASNDIQWLRSCFFPFKAIFIHEKVYNFKNRKDKKKYARSHQIHTLSKVKKHTSKINIQKYTEW